MSTATRVNLLFFDSNVNMGTRLFEGKFPLFWRIVIKQRHTVVITVIIRAKKRSFRPVSVTAILPEEQESPIISAFAVAKLWYEGICCGWNQSAWYPVKKSEFSGFIKHESSHYRIRKREMFAKTRWLKNHQQKKRRERCSWNVERRKGSDLQQWAHNPASK